MMIILSLYFIAGIYGFFHFSAWLTNLILSQFDKYHYLTKATITLEKQLKKQGWNGLDEVSLEFKDNQKMVIKVVMK